MVHNEEPTLPLEHFGRHDDVRAVSKWELARFAAGELDAGRRSAIEDALGADANLRDELAQLENERAAFMATMPFARFSADHAERTAQTQSFMHRFRRLVFDLVRKPVVISGALAACALLLFVVVNPTGPAQGGLRSKGGAELAFFVKDGEQVRLGKDGETLRQGDRIQFAVRDDVPARSMVILGIDGNGAVTVYAQDSVARDKGGATVHEPRILPRSVILDDAVGTERFFVLYADEPVDALAARATAEAKALVAAGTDLSTVRRLPLDVRAQNSVHIVKGTR